MRRTLRFRGVWRAGRRGAQKMKRARGCRVVVYVVKTPDFPFVFRCEARAVDSGGGMFMIHKMGGLFLALVLLLFASPPAGGARAASGEAAEARDWTIVLGEAARYVRGDAKTPGLTQGHLLLVRQIRARANDAKARLQEELRLSRKLLRAVGPPPPGGGPPEARGLAEKREGYQRRIAAVRARIAEADLALVRAEELEEALSAARLERFLGDMYSRTPIPFSPGVIARGGPEMMARLGRILRSPSDWRAQLPPGAGVGGVLLPGAVILIFGAFLGWAIRRSVLDMFGRDPNVPEPSYARRFGAAVAEGVGNGALPGVILTALYVWVTRPGALVSGLFAGALASFLLSALFFVGVVAFARAFLSPDQSTWRLTSQSPADAQGAYRWILVLAALFSIDMFFSNIGHEREGSAESMAVYAALFGVLEGLFFVRLSRWELWRTEAASEGAARERGRAWRLACRTARGLAVVGVVALCAGYGVFGRRLLTNLILTGLLLLVMALLRGLIRELVSWLSRSAFVREKLRLSSGALGALRSWERAMVDPLVLVLGVVLIVPVWGVPADVLIRWTAGVLTEFQVGSVRISIVDIVLAVLVFFLAMAGVRFLQRQLSERLLEQTGLPSGVRHSLNAGLGYAGVIVAVLLSISVTGVDLSNLALVASALSVGIGFGLQNVVNNFVSGLILLAERPVKVGDWVRVGNHEGIVKKIQFRATELETWQRASVIIPNAEIVSTSVVNLTHRDQYGRVEVGVGVAYDSDVQKVREILLDVARKNERVSEFPAPGVVFRDFGESSLDFELRCFTSNVMGRLGVGSDLRFEIERRLREAGVEIPFPQRVVHLTNPPEGERAEDP